MRAFQLLYAHFLMESFLMCVFIAPIHQDPATKPFHVHIIIHLITVTQCCYQLGFAVIYMVKSM